MDLVSSNTPCPSKGAVIVDFLTSDHLGEVALKNERAVSRSLKRTRSPRVKDPEAIPFFTRRQRFFTLIGKHLGRPAKEVKERFPL
jgi:hypothetical protein